MSDITITQAQINKIVADVRVKQDELKKEVTSATETVVATLKELLINTPEIEGVRWNQYTPYFNDGDECIFSVNDLEIKFNENLLPETKEFGVCYNEDGYISEFNLEDYFEKQKEVINFKEIEKVEKSLDKKINLMYYIHEALAEMKDALKDTFGDHVEITVTRSGIETEEYSHE